MQPPASPFICREGKALGDCWKSLSPSSGPGRVYVGMPTSQTTGGRFHLAAPFYPTVERELIDFGSPVLAKWNEELLSVAGVCCGRMHARYCTLWGGGGGREVLKWPYTVGGGVYPPGTPRPRPK